MTSSYTKQERLIDFINETYKLDGLKTLAQTEQLANDLSGILVQVLALVARGIPDKAVRNKAIAESANNFKKLLQQEAARHE